MARNTMIQFNSMKDVWKFLERNIGLFPPIQKQNRRRKPFRFAMGGLEKVYPGSDRITIDENV